MPVKPMIASQLMGQTGLGRPGAAMSAGSAPKVMQGTKGANFSAMENTLLKGPKPDPKALSGSSGGRHYNTLAAGGEITKSPKLPKAFGIRKAAPAQKFVKTPNVSSSANIFSKREK